METSIITRASTKIYERLFANKLRNQGRIRSQMKAIYLVTGERLNSKIDLFYIEILKNSILVILVSIFLFLIVFIKAVMDKTNAIEVVRNDYGQYDKEINLLVEEDTYEDNIYIDVPAIIYTHSELNDIGKKVIEYIDDSILINNSSFDHITDNIYLPESTNYTGVYIQWEIDDYSLVSMDGTVHNENLNTQQLVNIKAHVMYETELVSKEYEVKICPKIYSEEELKSKEIKEYIEKILGNSPYEKIVYIPEEYEGVTIKNEEKHNSISLYIVILAGIVCVLLYFRQKEIINSKFKDRNKELLKNYPLFINKLVLLLGAGLTLRGAFLRMSNNKEDKGYLYDEMVFTVHEIEAGIPETAAYYNFGRRIGLPPYLKASTLLIQNVTMGSKGLLPLLEQEELVAFEQRKELAKRQGEEAGTKLLFPMIIQMLIVMLIIMIPALMNFNM